MVPITDLFAVRQALTLFSKTPQPFIVGRAQNVIFIFFPRSPRYIWKHVFFFFNQNPPHEFLILILLVFFPAFFFSPLLLSDFTAGNAAANCFLHFFFCQETSCSSTAPLWYWRPGTHRALPFLPSGALPARLGKLGVCSRKIGQCCKKTVGAFHCFIADSV